MHANIGDRGGKKFGQLLEVLPQYANLGLRIHHLDFPYIQGMTAVELKAQLHSLIDQEDSLEKLEAIKAVLSGEEGPSPSWDEGELKRRIAQGDQEIAEGKMILWEEAKARMEAYFDEK